MFDNYNIDNNKYEITPLECIQLLFIPKCTIQHVRYIWNDLHIENKEIYKNFLKVWKIYISSQT